MRRPIGFGRRRPSDAGTRQRGRIAPRRLAIFGIVGFLLAAPLLGAVAAAQDVTFFRIGTGTTAGTYFPIGGIIANAISKPPGSRECDLGGSCGVTGLIAVAQSTEGSVANLEAIHRGDLESGLSQADIAYWAYNGNGIFKANGALDSIRAVANLFPESVHLVVSQEAGIREVADVRGKRISVDREGSGTRVDAVLILEAYGIGPSDLELFGLPAGEAADALRAGEIDGFFFVAGTPAAAVTELAADNLISLVPISGTEIEDLLWIYPFFAKSAIPSGTYFNVPRTETLSVGAQLIVSEKLSDDMVYEITRALWNENTAHLLKDGHPKGELISAETALSGLAIPLHPGAERWYREQSLIGGADESGLDETDPEESGLNGAEESGPAPETQ